MKAVKKFHISVLAVPLLSASIGLAPSIAGANPRLKDNTVSIELSAGIGARTADLQWSIASDRTGNETPNILSELTYADIELEEIITNGTITINKGSLAGLILQGKFLAGEATSGTNQDSDYNGDNRTEEYSRSYSSAKGSETLEIDLAAGYQIKMGEHLSFTPKIAYSYNEQHMKMTEGVQILDTRVVALSLGPFNADLNSSYTAEWEGIWLGGNLAWQTEKHGLSFELQFHFQEYYAEANWNLREDFDHPVSFAHWADGTGTRWSIKYQYQFSNRFSAWVEASADEFETDPGRDIVYFANGSKGATRLNVVNWQSSSYIFGIALNF